MNSKFAMVCHAVFGCVNSLTVQRVLYWVSEETRVPGILHPVAIVQTIVTLPETFEGTL